LVLPERGFAAPISLIAGSNHHINDTDKPSPKQDGDEKMWESLALLNTLIAITGLYYEQGSFACGDGTCALFAVPLNCA
jgi:hypothetical protein